MKKAEARFSAGLVLLLVLLGMMWLTKAMPAIRVS